MMILLVSSCITIGLACLATQVIKINFLVAFLLSVVFGIGSGLLGIMSYGLLMVWLGNWLSPLVLGLAMPRNSFLLGLLTNTVAIITELIWESHVSFGSFDWNSLVEKLGKNSEANLFVCLIGAGTSLLVTVPIFYFGYYLSLKGETSGDEI